jgi:hypothetical protein
LSFILPIIPAGSVTLLQNRGMKLPSGWETRTPQSVPTTVVHPFKLLLRQPESAPLASGRKHQAASNLEDKNSRKPDSEFDVPGLVTKHEHSGDAAGAASRQGNRKKRGFRNSP